MAVSMSGKPGWMRRGTGGVLRRVMVRTRAAAMRAGVGAAEAAFLRVRGAAASAARFWIFRDGRDVLGELDARRDGREGRDGREPAVGGRLGVLGM